ncbi:MAG: LAGLIDADG family homing endonuclease [Candidatus Aenigmatarchaeota archaeon]
MRVILKNGKQRELILKAKRNKTWLQLSKMVGVSKDYLRIDLLNEKVSLNSEVFKKLCQVAEVEFYKHIDKKLEDNWGKVLGGKNSPGKTKKIMIPEKSIELAEIIGIILGDGNLYWNGEKGVYALKIAGDLKTERDYLLNFVKPLVDDIFKINSKIEMRKNEIFITVYSKEIIKILESFGLKNGNKKVNNVGIPEWIKTDTNFLKSCIRGLIDTDGSIFRMSRRDRKLLRISFKNKSKNLLFDARSGLISLGFSPSKIILDQFFLSKKEEIEKYKTNIRFNNIKHVRRMLNIAP